MNRPLTPAPSLFNHLAQWGSDQQRRFWLLPIVLGVLFPLLSYEILPWLGLTVLENVFTFTYLTNSLFLLVSGTFYLIYLGFILKRPQHLVYFFLILWPLIEYINNLLLVGVGINLHLRFLLVLALGLPSVLLTLRNLVILNRAFTFIKYFVAFWACQGFYFLYFNANAANPRWLFDNAWFEGSIGMVNFTFFCFCFIGILATANAIVVHPAPRRFFDTLNFWMLLVSSAICLVTIAGFPLGLFGKVVDGFYRALGLYSHPNPYSYHMGTVLIYMIGLFFYYQGPEKSRMPQGLMVGSLVIHAIALLLGLSKAGISLFLSCGLILILSNLTTMEMRRRFFQFALLALLIAPVAYFAYSAITGTDLGDVVQARIDDTTSMEWRMSVWQKLLGNIDEGKTLLFGHGSTAANEFILRLSYNSVSNPTPLIMVHNGYLELLYDFGLLGFMIFVAMGVLTWRGLALLKKPEARPLRPLMITVPMLFLFFLGGCGFDEIIHMFDAPVFMWSFGTLLYGYALRELNAL